MDCTVKKKPFVHLHLHTCYSLLDGACKVNQLVSNCADEEMPAVAMTDHGVMYGAVEFFKAAKKKGIKPLIGCETYLTTGSRHSRGADAKQDHMHHLVLLAKDQTGYKNLSRLVSTGFMEGFYYKPRIDKDILAQHSKGLIGLSACLKGEVAGHLVNDDISGAVAAADSYAQILGKDNFYLEVMDHGIPEQRKVAQLLPKVAAETGLPILATNDVHYLERDHARAHDVLLCLQTGTVLSDPKRMRYSTDEFYLKTRNEMAALFKDFPGALDRTLEVAERCNLELELNKLHFPTYHVEQGMTQKQYLYKLTIQGTETLYGVNDLKHPKNPREQELLDRLNHELAVIEKMGFINYFLVVWDFVHFARDQKIPVGPGRGSGGGSLVAYALGITAIDPLHYDLIFERFLNPERVSPPDFDIDFCMDRRGEVIEYVKKKYGTDHVAQIITFGSLGAKTVIRDVGRVLEIPYGQCDQWSKMIPEDPKMTLKKAMEQNPDFKRAYDTDPDCKRILDYGFVLEGLYRNPGTHAAGVVIGEKPLIEIVPLCRDKDKQPVTQYSKYPVEEVGLLKMDFLGLKTLTVLKEAVDLVKETQGGDIDLHKLPLDDETTYDLLSRGDTVGVFQLESGGMRDLIRRISMTRIEDLIAMIALYRPGPMNMLPDFVDRKSGKKKIKYDHPLLEPILKETYGVMVYQEQVQKAANVLAGHSLGQADMLRRAMGKKIPEVMQKQRASFVKGCKATHNIDEKLAGSIFDNMEKFAGYGFNKAHSTGYAIVSYQTAYMKANYPAEFMAALLCGEIGNFDKIPIFVGEAVQMGLEILPPDINQSSVRFRPDGKQIRYGLAGVKNVGYGAAERIVSERKTGGTFTGMIDFCSRVDGQLANKKVIESLVRCGAFDNMNMHRARLFEGIDFSMSRAQSVLKDRQSGQGNLFSMLEEQTSEGGEGDEAIPNCRPWHENELLAGERELLGMYMSGHPLTQHAWLLEKYQTATVSNLKQIADRTPVRIGGLVATLHKRVTKANKESMAILVLEDLDGSVEAIVFPEAYQRYGAALDQDVAVLICGEVSHREDQPRIMAQEIYRLEEAPKHFTQRISIHIPAASMDKTKLTEVKDAVRLHPGLTPVVLCVEFPQGEKVFIRTDAGFRVMPTQALIQSLTQILGESSVYMAISPEIYTRPPAGRHERNRNGA